jgi:tetratricopeptide (TPR) repeat protein
VRIRRTILALAAAASVAAPAVPVAAQGIAGAYLAARQAGFDNNYREAARYFAEAIAADPGNPGLLESGIRANIGAGDMDAAIAIARRFDRTGFESSYAALATLAGQFKDERYEDVLEDIAAGNRIAPMVDGLLAAWAEFGLGRMSAALDRFDEVAETQGGGLIAYYNKALALARVGDLEGADEILSGRAHGSLQLDRRGVMAHVQILSQLERNEDALAVLEERFGLANLDASVVEMRARLEAGETLTFTTLPDAQAGVAEVFYVVAGALSGDTSAGTTLLYSRAAEYLRPDHIEAILFSASMLEQQEQYDLATVAYNRVPRDHPAFDTAEIGRAEALRKSGRSEAAIEVLQQLARARPENPSVHMTLGDTLRQLERYDEASQAYDEAIALLEEDRTAQWVLYFARGITHEREDRWPQAEADFRKALELRPEQPQVLNYLGYSFVEMGVNMDEALDLIERAVAAEPNSGYIVDSLGWVLFRLGEYEEAVVHLERATELLPVDPIINDHLGDAYYAVGRKLEAEFQWKRALSFDPEEDEADRIRRKLEVGLDVVRAEEGDEPIHVANDDG